MKRYFVGVSRKNKITYPENPPYNPPCIYPEQKKYFSYEWADKSNHIYPLIRDSFKLLKYDIENYGSSHWNPLGWLITPGMTVFIKPNMIANKHLFNNDWDYVITHGSVIRAVIDYVFLAIEGRGRIIIGDGPQSDSKFSEIVSLLGFKQIQALFNKFEGMSLEIINLQDEQWIVKNGISIEKIKLPGDPAGSVCVDLADHSMFSEFNGMGKRYYGGFYNVDETNEHHRDSKHEYLIARTPLISDVFINIPKLKTHKKCGITVNLKSLVGINANKNWLPHYIFGSPSNGGDQFARKTTKKNMENILVVWAKKNLARNNSYVQLLARRFKSLAYKIFGSTEKVIRSGNWYGNDTVWRMSIDLNRILMYGNFSGAMCNSTEKKPFLSIVDGIYSMEGNGPVAGNKKETGVVIAGDNPVSVDAVCAKIMGFDYKKLPIIYRALEKNRYPLIKSDGQNIFIFSNIKEWNRRLEDIKFDDSFKFKPHFGWIGHVEDM